MADYTRFTNVEVTGELVVDGSFVNPVVAGDTFYVDVNAGSATGDGLSWDTAFNTLALAITASNASISAGASGWAARNRIYFKGDNNEAHKETLVTLANKCDIIGVGSYDHRAHPMMIGNHVIGAGAYMGCRFINMGFKSLAAGGAIFTVPTTTSGLAFIGCTFDGRTATPATYGLVATAVEELIVSRCRFVGRFSVAAISIGAGSSRMLNISDNFIDSGAAGILVNASMTTSDCAAYITRNVFNVVTIIINDASGKITIMNNSGRTAAAKEVATAFVCGTGMGANNTFGNATGWGVYPAVAAIS
ncbi:MAG TPA: hypothetical protein PKL77_06250 [Candidatus Omnitrophota bacterium]|nr:hypothetical protein [Candidatus Omnitrophota bacterium]